MVIPETKSHWLRRAALLLALTVQPLCAQVPELETIFYGRVVNRSSGQEYQITSGTLTVTVAAQGLAPLDVSTPLKSHADGKYSYVLKMPHQAKSLDLAVDGGKLPLFVADTDFENVSIKVNGQPARVLGTGTTSFIASQARRGGVHRLDLEVFDKLDDTDGDGIPDWWEDLHGLDKQDASDALLRWGDNIYTYGDAFRLGLNPQADDRRPELLTSELMVVENAASGLLPRTVASISTPAQIRYRITGLPEGGDLVLRNARPDPNRADRILKAGDSFTQADADAGRVEFVHRDPAVALTRIQVSITNNNLTLAPLEGEIELTVFRPDAAAGRAGERWLDAVIPLLPKQNDTALEIWRRRATESFSEDWIGGSRQRDWIGAYLLARRFGYTLWDGTRETPVKDLRVPSAAMSVADFKKFYVGQYGQPRKHVIFAGNGESRVEGGMNHDVLLAGVGETTLRGNAGADFFVVSEGTTIVEDFKPAEADLLDLSPLLQGWPGPLADKVNVSFNAGNTWLRVPLGGGQEAMVILQGLNINATQLEALRRKGSVFTGAISGVIYATNRAPVAVADEGYIVAGQPVSIPVLANDHDPDGDALSIKSVTQGAFGTVNIANGILLYTPGPNFAGTDTFNYTVIDGQGGFASVAVKISYPFPAAAGIYTSLMYADDGAPIGQLSLNVQRTGAFTVTLNLRGVRYAGKGAFDAAGAALVTLKAGKASVDLSLNIDLANPPHPLTGALVELPGGATLEPAVVAANPVLVPTTATRFTVAAGAPAGVDGLTGWSFATITVSTRYAVVMAGKLADNTPFTASTVQDRTGNILWTTSLYKNSGWVLGQFSLTREAGAQPVGTLKWSKPAGTQPAFVAALPTQISKYLGPAAAAVSVLDFADDLDRRADFVATGGGLAAAAEVSLVFQKADAVAVAEPVRKFALTRTTGLFTGTIFVDGAARAIQGVVLQAQNQGYGFFLNGTASGAISLSPQ